MVSVRPLAANGNWATISSVPGSLASAGFKSTLTISVSVKHTAGMATGSNCRRTPLMISATISLCADALCASIGSPTRSPIAHTSRIDVRQRPSMRTNGAAISTAIASSPQPSVRGLQSTVTNTLSATARTADPSDVRTVGAAPPSIRSTASARAPRWSVVPARPVFGVPEQQLTGAEPEGGEPSNIGKGVTS